MCLRESKGGGGGGSKLRRRRRRFSSSSSSSFSQILYILQTRAYVRWPGQRDVAAAAAREGESEAVWIERVF